MAFQTRNPVNRAHVELMTLAPTTPVPVCCFTPWSG